MTDHLAYDQYPDSAKDEAVRLYVEEPSLSLAEIERRTGVPKSVIHYNMVKRGYPTRNQRRVQPTMLDYQALLDRLVACERRNERLARENDELRRRLEDG